MFLLSIPGKGCGPSFKLLCHCFVETGPGVLDKKCLQKTDGHADRRRTTGARFLKAFIPGELKTLLLYSTCSLISYFLYTTSVPI